MKTKKDLLFTVSAFFAFFLLCGITSFKMDKDKKPCEVTCQWSPTTSNFANVSLDNCNSSQSNISVTAGTSWTPILNGTGCTNIFITTVLPSTHPSGTIRIYKNGVQQITHTLTANQHAAYDDNLTATCNDYFLVTW